MIFIYPFTCKDDYHHLNLTGDEFLKIRHKLNRFTIDDILDDSFDGYSNPEFIIIFDTDKKTIIRQSFPSLKDLRRMLKLNQI